MHERHTAHGCHKHGMMHHNGCAPDWLDWLMYSLFLSVRSSSQCQRQVSTSACQQMNTASSTHHGLLSGIDACRFAGAIPEVANSRLAMLGVVLGLGAEITTGEQCCDMSHSLQSGTIVDHHLNSQRSFQSVQLNQYHHRCIAILWSSLQLVAEIASQHSRMVCKHASACASCFHLRLLPSRLEQ